MEKIKTLAKKGWDLLKAQVIKDWNGGYFKKGRIIFIGIIIILFLIKLIAN
tara:strand:+ start:1182 stop:1334 length:153 start_codon:yes stop_codon:yes gene_type:complete